MKGPEGGARRQPLSFDETLILVLVLGFIGGLMLEIIAAILLPGFRDTAAGLITATGAVLSLPVTAYIGLRFTREIRANGNGAETAQANPGNPGGNSDGERGG